MLRVLPPSFKPVKNLICCKTGLMWLVKRATLLFSSFCSNVARQVACLCCSYCSNVARQVACFLLPDLPYLYTFEKRKEKLRPAHQQTRHPSERYSHKNALLSALSALRFVIIKIRSKETLIESCTS